jgi:hypothetical protein
MAFPRGVERTNVAAISSGVMMAMAIFCGCGGGSSTGPAPQPASVAVTLSPSTATVQANQATSFTATVSNDPQKKGTSWSLSGAGCTGAACGSLFGMTAASGAGVMYTAPAAVPNPPTVTLIATAVDDTTKSAKATITLTPPPALPPTVSVTPGTANVATGAVTQTFAANVTNDAQNLGVTWSLSGTNCTGAGCGSISPATSASGTTVTYTSAARATSAGTVTITAPSVAEGSVVGTAAVTLAAPTAPTTNAPKFFTPVAVDAGFGIPAIASDSSGNVDLAWMNFDGIHVVRSTDGGANFSHDVLIPSDLSLNSQNNLLKMVVDPAGDINLLWYRDVDGLGTNFAYYISRSSDSGATYTAPLQFTTSPIGNVPAIVGRPDGKLVVTWVDSSLNVIAEVTSDGVDLSAPITIAAAVPGVAGEEAVVGPDGHVYVLWQTGDSTNCSISFSSSTDATTYTVAKTVSGGSGTCNSQPAASVDSTGNVDATWVADSTSLYFTRSVDGGANFSTPIPIATPANPTGDEVIAGPDGGIYVLWTAAGGATFANSQNSGASFATNATPLGVSLDGGPPSFTVDACGNVTVFGGSGHVDSTYQRSNDGGITFAAAVDISGPPHQDFEQQLAIDKSGNVNFTWAVDGPSSVNFARLPTVCHVQ